MKRLLLILFIIPLISFGQTETKRDYYTSGKLLSIIDYKDGQLESRGTYKYTELAVYSRKDGVWKYYYDDGQLQRESIIKGGGEELKFYDKDGISFLWEMVVN